MKSVSCFQSSNAPFLVPVTPEYNLMSSPIVILSQDMANPASLQAGNLLHNIHYSSLFPYPTIRSRNVMPNMTLSIAHVFNNGIVQKIMLTLMSRTFSALSLAQWSHSRTDLVEIYHKNIYSNNVELSRVPYRHIFQMVYTVSTMPDGISSLRSTNFGTYFS